MEGNADAMERMTRADSALMDAGFEPCNVPSWGNREVAADVLLPVFAEVIHVHVS